MSHASSSLESLAELVPQRAEQMLPLVYEPLLATYEGYQACLARVASAGQRLREISRLLIRLYTALDQPDKQALWQQRFDEHRGKAPPNPPRHSFLRRIS